MTHAPRARTARLSILLALVATCLVFASAAVAFAAPQAPTMGLTELNTKLESGPLTGYFKTVVRGETISEVPVEVLAVTGDASNSSLILFESSGPIIDKFGGIASGMSGSPVYVDDNGTDKLIGAVSYGDYFTLGGTGLATPIEAMMDIENRFAPSVQPLDAPVLAGSSVISSVLVVPNPEDYAGAAAQGSLVAKPLSSVFVGGLSPKSHMYKRLEAGLKSEGVNLVPLAATLGGTAMKNGVPYFAEFEAGGSVAALGATGDLWMGGLGTVTYTSDNVVLAFGHPAYWDGPSSLFMTNAWIDGIWPSQMAPYKIGRPGAMHGAITQDRSAGIMGLDDLALAETPITAFAVNTNTGESASSAVYMPTDFLAVNDGRSLMAASGAYMAGSKLFDQYAATGSALTTTTIVVSDGVDEHTITMTNLVDSSYDIAYDAVWDVETALSELLSITDSGLAQPRILSVDLQSEISAARRNAEVVDVVAPQGLRAGADNPVKVSLLEYGVAATQTIDATISIPAGTRIEGGTLVASAPGGGYDMGEYGEEGVVYYYDEYFESSVDRRSVADVVAELNSAPRADTLAVRFYPGPELDIDGYPIESEEMPEAVAETLAQTGSVLMGEAQKTATRLTVKASPSTVPYGGATDVYGKLYGVEGSGMVYVYGTVAGETAETLLGTGSAEYVGSYAVYDVFVAGLKKNTSLRVVYEGDPASLACEKAGSVKVKAKVTYSPSATRVSKGTKVKLSAKVAPVSTAGTSVVFEYYSTRYGKWRTISTRTLAAAAGATSATASYSWAPPATVNTRVRFLGNMTNVATTSSTKTIYVK